MHSTESHVLPPSDYYMYTPSQTAKMLFFYPLISGYFYYDANYHLSRKNYNSYLIMLITKGSCHVSYSGNTTTALVNDVVFLDCNHTHSYTSNGGFEALWLHFDGPMASAYATYLLRDNSTVFNLTKSNRLHHHLEDIYTLFKAGHSINEPRLSNSITSILTELLLSGTPSSESTDRGPSIENTIHFINEHFSRPLSLNDLAEQSALSPYYFTRIFTKETGMTPYQYLIQTRLSAAKYLLKTSSYSIKEITFSCGFGSESNFCYTFKKWEHMTPSQYRHSENHGHI